MSTEKNLINLVINKVESQDVYDYMKANSLINADELYVIAGGDQIATETDDGLMSSEDKIKLDNIEENANNYIHPAYTSRSNGLYKVTIDSTGHVSNATAVEKDDITDLGIPAQDTTYSEATTATSGLMSSSDKTKLDSIPAEKGNYQYLVTDGEGNTMWEDRLGYKAVIKNVVVEKSAAAFQSHMAYKGTYCSERLPFFDSSLSYAIVTVDGVEYELHGSNGIVGNKYLASDSMEDTGEPVCLKMDVDIETSEFGCLIITNLSGSIHDIVISVPEETVVKIPEEYMPYEFVKVESGKGLSTNDYTTVEKTKLSNIEDGANKTIVDTALSSTSTNPVQNKVINTKLDSMQSDIDSKVPSSRTVNGKALTANITLSASDVGALPNTTQIPSIDGLATETYVDNKVAGLVDSAPAALDTLNELAAALGDDPNFATTVATQIGTKVDKVDGKGLSTNDYTNAEKTKLSGIAEGAEVNQNAFSNVVIGSTTVSADSTTDTLTLIAGDNVTLTPNATSDSITIAATDTVYTHPRYTARTGVPTANQTPSFGGTFTISQPVSDSTGHITAINSRTVTIPSTTASTSANGLMTSTQATKLNGIAEGAQVNQNAFSNVVVGSTTIAADSATDTLTLAAGDNVTLTPDATNDKITIKANIPVATSIALGGVKSGTDIVVDSNGNVSVKDDSHNHIISNVDGLQDTLNAKVPTSRTVNGKALSSDIVLSASDVSARPNTWTPSASDVGALPLSGGTLTGNLTGKYITGTWLQSTANNHLGSKPPKVCVQDASGRVYHRTTEELRDDLGAAPAYTYGTEDLVAGTSELATGTLYFVYE